MLLNKTMSQLVLKNMTLVWIDFHTTHTLSYNHDKRLCVTKKEGAWPANF